MCTCLKTHKKIRKNANNEKGTNNTSHDEKITKYTETVFEIQNIQLMVHL